VACVMLGEGGYASVDGSLCGSKQSAISTLRPPDKSGRRLTTLYETSGSGGYFVDPALWS
jgi:hypothetical protein